MTTELDIATNGQPPATRGGTRSALAITADQTDWTPAQLAALRQLGIEDAPEGDLAVFRHVCMATGLDPFRKEIYMIGRKTKTSYFDEDSKQWVDHWGVKYTIQTGIDGFRKNGRKAAKREGDTIRVDGPYWQGTDGGGWTDVWLSDQPPAAAKFTIFRDGEAHTGIAMYREFVQTDRGGRPNSMWSKMPANQTAKCAEAQAWRRAYPDDFAGMQLEDAMQVLDADPAATTRAYSQRVTAGEILAAAPAAEAPKVQQWQAPDEESKPDTSDPAGPQEPTPDREPEAYIPLSPEKARRKPTYTAGGITGVAVKLIGKLLDDLGVTDSDDKTGYLREFFKRPELVDVRELTPGEGKDLIAELKATLAAPTVHTGDTVDAEGGAQ